MEDLEKKDVSDVTVRLRVGKPDRCGDAKRVEMTVAIMMSRGVISDRIALPWGVCAPLFGAFGMRYENYPKAQNRATAGVVGVW